MEKGRIYPKKGISKRRLIKMYFNHDIAHDDFLELFEIVKRNYYRYCNHISWTSQVLSENRVKQETENNYEFVPRLKYKKKPRIRFKDIRGVSRKLLNYFKFPKKDYCILRKTHLGINYYYFFFNKNFMLKKSLRNIKTSEYLYVPEPFFDYLLENNIMANSVTKGSDNEIYEFKEGYYNNVRQFFGFRYSEIEKVAYLEQLRQEGLDYLVKKNFLK